MKNGVFMIIILIQLSAGCTGGSQRVNDAGNGPDQPDAAAQKNERDQQEEIDCVFDTSSFKFTSEALKKYDPHIKFVWNDKEKQAMAKLANGDSLVLGIGGCNHFGYYANLFTTVPFNDAEKLIQKTRWVARNFFTNGFDEVYDQWIGEGKYEQLENDDPATRSYRIVNSDTTETNMIYEDFFFRRTPAGTEIAVGGYIN